ncbi:MAG TPA: cytochrome B [Gammaproteobacteria bacterium]|nr:cytochrome B [Gammaproteobacteria bacterium]
MHEQNQVKVWDPLLRIFHWLLAGAFFVAYLTEDELLTPHVWAGYLIIGLLVFRLLWGFIGPQHARFSDFVTPPRVALEYLKGVFNARARRYLGHNPAGGWMIVLLLVMLVLVSATGLMVYAAEEQAGPLAAVLGAVGEGWEEAFEETHEFLANFTLVLVFIHLGGVIVESLLHRENLARAMITGYKRR